MSRLLDNRVRTAYRGIRLKQQRPQIAQHIEREFKLGSIAARILAARGFKPDQDLKNFIAPSLKEGLPDPRKLKNLDAACALISEIAASGGKVAICCDFDVDGLSGGAQANHFLTAAGVETRVFVPDRFTDGYGLNERLIKAAADWGAKLLIAIDYGTRNQKEIAVAKALGLKTIVIDHHHVGSAAPGADVFINPQQRGCGFAGGILCASGLVWYLLVGLRSKLPRAANLDVRSYLDLACLGTICDMVPLIGANRVIAKRGLDLLGTTKRPGLVALKSVIGINGEVSCSNVGFGIGPRLNAAGRMVHGEMVIDLLTTDDSELAARVARQLNKLNTERQETELRVKEIAVEYIRGSGYLPSGLVVWDKEFHTGVIGIVAQRLVEQFYRPAVVMGLDTDGIFKGSVRGIKGFSVVEALEACAEHLIKCGGHEGAGGFSVEEARIEAFKEAFEAECARRLDSIEVVPYAEADTEAQLEDIEMDLVHELEQFAPFGMGNPGPQILLAGLKVVEVKILKNAHLKATFSDGKRYLAGFLWRQTSHPALNVGATVNVVCKPDYSVFNGQTEIQANLQAIEKAA
ncbi:MAG: single-stranded-DNA-specific exonuclease RecJ [Oligoflexia bacterium]|nr:single-stranded-DNA-specific exonuclease RecJ [Oligoflexia bacterium]